MRPRKVDPQAIRRLHAQGMTDREMADVFGVDKTSVWYHRRRMGLPVNRSTKVDSGEVRRLHAQGMSDRQMARALRVSRPTIMHHRRRMGLPATTHARKAVNFTEDEVKRLTAMAQQGHTVGEMAAALGRRYGVIRNRLIRSSIPYTKSASRGFRAYHDRRYLEIHVPIIEDYLRDPEQPWETIAEKHGTTDAQVRNIVGRHLMKRCREAEACAYSALLPEYHAQEEET